MKEARRVADHALTLDCSEVDSGEELTARLSTMATGMHVDEIVLLQNVGLLAQRSPAIIIRPQERSVVVRGRHVGLTKREFEILAAVAANGGALSREQLGAIVWPGRSPAATRSLVKVYVLRLRRRLGADAGILATTRLGYTLAGSVRTKDT